MRQVFLGVVVLLLYVVSGHAQTGDPARNYDFEKPLYTVVDLATKGYFGGWSGDCNSGRIPSSFMLWRVDASNNLVNVPVTVTTGPRSDAAAWLAATCGRPFDVNVGWSLVPVTPEPAGKFQYVVLVTDVPTSWSCSVMRAGYLNAGQMVCDCAANSVYRIVR